MQGGAVEARLAHTQKVGGAIPSPASKFVGDENLRITNTKGSVYSVLDLVAATGVRLTRIVYSR